MGFYRRPVVEMVRGGGIGPSNPNPPLPLGWKKLYPESNASSAKDPTRTLFLKDPFGTYTFLTQTTCQTPKISSIISH